MVEYSVGLSWFNFFLQPVFIRGIRIATVGENSRIFNFPQIRVTWRSTYRECERWKYGARGGERERESRISYSSNPKGGGGWFVEGRSTLSFLSAFHFELKWQGAGQTQIHFLNVVLYARNCTENTYSRGGGQCERGGSITNAIKLSVDGSRSVLVYQDEAASVEC